MKKQSSATITYYSKFLFASILLCLAGLQAVAFDKPMKWGKVTKNDLLNIKDASGKNYSAIVICDYGEMGFDVNLNVLRYTYSCHVRIKIMNTKGYDRATVQIPYFSAWKEETLNDIDGQCFYLNEKGDVEKKELEKKLIFNEKINDYYSRLRFTIPGVKEGCIIEYKYTLYSQDYTDMQKWYFQSDVPVLRSELHINIPDYFAVSPNYKGSIKLEPKEENTFTDHWVLDTRGETDAYEKREERMNQNDFVTNAESMTIPGREIKYVALNVPALESEPYITDLKNYWAAMSFELRNITIPGYIPTEISSTWGDMLKKLINSSRFGGELEGNKSLGQSAAQLTTGITDKKEKMKIIYDFVKNNMTLDYGTRIIVSDLSKRWENHSGTKSDINMILIKMLQSAGLAPKPVLISTRDNGPVISFYPSWYQFDAVLAYVKIDDAVYLLDATDKDRPYDVLDDDDLNGSGLVVELPGPKWIKIENAAASQSTSFAMMSINKDGKVSCNLSQSFAGYSALDKRKDIKKSGLKTYIEHNLNSVLPDVEIGKYSVTNLDTASAPLKLQQEFSTMQLSNSGGNILYLSSLLNLLEKENPFTADDRILPITLSNTVENNYIVNISLPDGYILNDPPKPIKIALTNDAAVYTYMVAQMGNQLQLRAKLSINATYYEPEDYTSLKSFFTQVMNKDNEKLTLKKSN